jgi:hypothetical protein
MDGTVTVRSSNAPPSVTTLAPGEGQQYAANDPVTFSASTQDDGQIDRVEFFEGVTSLGVARSSPFNVSVALPPGAHSVTARATDDEGLTAESQAVTFQVNTNHRPTVSITEPIADQMISLPAPFALKVQAADADGDIAKVDYFDEDNTGKTNLIGTATAAPFSLIDPKIPDGVATLGVMAVATDSTGLSRTSAPVRFFISRPITLSIYPSPNAGRLIVMTTPAWGTVQTEVSTNLSGTNWSHWSGPISPDGNLFAFEINQDQPQLFFRTMAEP